MRCFAAFPVGLRILRKGVPIGTFHLKGRFPMSILHIEFGKVVYESPLPANPQGGGGGGGDDGGAAAGCGGCGGSGSGSGGCGGSGSGGCGGNDTV